MTPCCSNIIRSKNGLSGRQYKFGKYSSEVPCDGCSHCESKCCTLDDCTCVDCPPAGIRHTGRTAIIDNRRGSLKIAKAQNRSQFRFSKLTNSEIQNQCASEHLPEMGPPSLEQQDAYDQCVRDVKAGRWTTRIGTFKDIGEWAACAFFGKCKGEGDSGGGNGRPAPDEKGNGNMIIMWVVVILLIIILIALAVKFFGGKK